MVMAGDFLSPSVASSVFKGEQMIAALNAAGLDLATLGNHEFDFGDDVLIQRMRESRFEWVVSNVVDTNTGQPIGGAAPYLVKTFGSLKVGFIGLCLNTDEITPDKLKHSRIIDPIAAAGQYLPALKREGADVIVAVTHLAFATDRALVERFPEIDLVIGGHEHFLITSTENRTLISKAGSDAKTRGAHRRQPAAAGTVERFYELLPISERHPRRPETAEVIESYEKPPQLGARRGRRHRARAARRRQPATCARRKPTSATSSPTRMRAEAGSRHRDPQLGQHPRQPHLPRRAADAQTLIEIHPFDNVIVKLAMPGRVVLQALNSGVDKLPAAGGHVPAGVRVEDDRRSERAAGRAASATCAGQRPAAPAGAHVHGRASPTSCFRGGDGYTMFADQRVLVGPEAGTLISTAIEKYVAAKREITQEIEGRIILR